MPAAIRTLLLAAVTVDGKIARHDHEPTDWSSREDKRLFAQVSRAAGALILGRRTYATLPAPLPGRLHLVLTTTPERWQADAPPEVEYTAAPPGEMLERLAARGYTSVVIAGGAAVYRAFLDAGLVDELWLTVEPLAFGAGVSLFGDAPLDLRLALAETRLLNAGSVLLRYHISAS